jgi:hypothetical protein
MGECKGFLVSHLVHAGTHESIIAEIATNVGRNDFTVDAVARDKVLVLSAAGRLRRRS